MSNILHQILIPVANVNDEFFTVAKINVKNGDYVHANSELAVIESTKTTMDLITEKSGYVYFLKSEGSEVPVGQVVAVISELKNDNVPELFKNKDNRRDNLSDKFENVTDTDGSKVRLTEKAKKLALNLGLDLTSLPTDRILRTSDIEQIYQTSNKNEAIPNSLSVSQDKNGMNRLSNKNNKILILGGGGHAKMCIDILRQMGTYEIYGIVDANLKIGTTILGIPVVAKHNKEELRRLFDEGYRMIVNGIGAVNNHSSRSSVFDELKDIGFYLPNLIHPRASLEPSAQLGEGNHIMAHATIGSAVEIGNNNIFNCNTVVSHDSHIFDNVHVAPGALLAGDVTVYDNTLIGMGTTVYFGVKIGSNVTIFNGSNISQDIENSQIIRP